MPSSAMTNLLASYIPRLIQKHVAQDPRPIEAPYGRNFYGIFLFADISGFTRLTERLAEKGPVGVEKLAYILNDYFGQLIDIVHEFGGDAIKFAGDAVIVAWPMEDQAGSREVQRQWMLRAVECAFMIRERLLNYMADGTRLDLKFSLSAGDVQESHIGGVYNRWEFVIVGNPLVEIGQANELAKAGDIITAPSAWELLKGACQGREFEFPLKPALPDRRTAARLEGIKTHSHMQAPPEGLEIPDEAQPALLAYLPGSIISRISAGQSDWLAELRKVTVVLVNLPEITHASSLESSQETMRLIQQVVYRFEGSINKISQDDKGVMIDAAFELRLFRTEMILCVESRRPCCCVRN